MHETKSQPSGAFSTEGTDTGAHTGMYSEEKAPQGGWVTVGQVVPAALTYLVASTRDLCILGRHGPGRRKSKCKGPETSREASMDVWTGREMGEGKWGL